MSGICEQSDLRFDDEFGGNIWVLFSGDMGGDSMKFHLEILNNRNVGSLDNVHCFCFYKGSDREEDILKRFQPFVRPLKEMGSKDFKLCGRNIQLFLGGDFKFLCAMKWIFWMACILISPMLSCICMFWWGT